MLGQNCPFLDNLKVTNRARVMTKACGCYIAFCGNEQKTCKFLPSLELMISDGHKQTVGHKSMLCPTICFWLSDITELKTDNHMQAVGHNSIMSDSVHGARQI